jgi:Xaa-Pro aminopeptidase
MSAFNQRIQLLRDLMKAQGLDAFVLRRNPNLAWAIAGRAHVPTTIDAACFDLIITQDSATAVTTLVTYQGGKVVTLTHAAQVAFSMRDAIQNAIMAALQTSWTNVVYDVTVPQAVSDIDVA